MANFIIDRGASWSVEVEFNDENGVNIDLTGATAEAFVRRKFWEDQAAVVATVLLTPLTDGKARFSLASGVSALIPLGRLCQLVCSVTSGAEVRKYVLGDVEGI